MSVEERATAADRVLAARERYVARGVSTPTLVVARAEGARVWEDRKSTRLNSSHSQISYAAFCWNKKAYRCGSRRRALRARLGVPSPHVRSHAHSDRRGDGPHIAVLRSHGPTQRLLPCPVCIPVI